MYMLMLGIAGLAGRDLSSLTRSTVGGQTMPIAKMEEVEKTFGCPRDRVVGHDGNRGRRHTFPVYGPHKLGSIGIALP